MELIRGIHNLKPHHQGCVLTIGNFDGVHRGHQSVLRQLIEKASQLNLPATVMTFEPQPLEMIIGDKAPARLTRLRDKYVALKDQNIDQLLCVNFNAKFAALSAEDFITQLLVKKLGVKYLVVGDDFRFGHKRAGDFAMLQAAGAKYGFDVVSMDTFSVAEARVSSTMIRNALAQDKLDLATELLGRPFSIFGKVSHGAKLGRTIGFPTANIPLKRCVDPINGVYVVEVFGIKDTAVQGVANIGKRPTVGGVRTQLEVNLFDFDGDLYGKQLEVVLKRKLRGEEKFASFDVLRQQIERDVIAAKNYFGLSV
ncbi:bifunctional riboflavin kinase/FAD synthetase [Moritella sp. 24]|uniref:bifunctional riboflavin kinase/FAD synthetase n=1 Tax=Moritella sp. 24 TaxID=2746230 RepID=UPI001BA71747|nr:bifunctional riboflavin kinase/FAD synthetase [Moritella sp. 24]QUM75214.1 bifunctional riboflavin kinase/FAD synthetase [Moritella sp. 24]